MDATFFLNVLTRWLHVASAIAAVGGALLLHFVVVPALANSPDGASIYDRLLPRFKKLLHSALGIALLTGFYNYLVVAIPRVRDLREAGGDAAARLAAYHPVMGVKILLSVALFGLAMSLLRPADSLENRKRGLTVNVVVGLLITLLAAYLRRLW